ncbi:MAG: AEC family transporter [Synergistaceae bacterium]|nr:AEC family transporter [Synergistaceae bacterium]
MNLDFFAVLSNLISLFALIAVGYIAARSGVVKPEATAAFSALLMKVTLPCTIFISLVQREYDPAFIQDSLTIIFAGLVVFPAMTYIARYIAVILGVPKNCRGVWAFLCAFTNSGFMGFPIAYSLFGAEGLALSVMLNIAFNMTIFTVGALEISRDNPEHEGEGLNVKSIIFSGINAATLLSLVFYFGGIKLPQTVATPITMISGITTPLSMMIVGMTLEHSKASDILKDIHAWTCTAMRLFVFPIALCLLLKVLPISSNPLVGAVLVIVVAMPGASITVPLCETYHGNIDFAAEAMFIQNILCMLSIPVVCMML